MGSLLNFFDVFKFSILQFDLGGRRQVYLLVSSGLEVRLAHPFDIQFTTKKNKWKSFHVDV